MVVEETTKNKGGAGTRVGGKGTRSTSKKNKQPEDSSESSDEDTQGSGLGDRTDKEDAEGSGTQSNSNVLKSKGLSGQQPGESNYTTIWCNHKARARPTHEGTDHRRNSH